MPTLNTNGIQIEYQVQGQGKPLVLIAGIGYSRWFWHKVEPGLAQHYRVISFDNRGSGGSGKPDGPYTVPVLAADAIGLMDELGISKAAVCGHSLGGYIAQELAITRPDLVGRLILASTNHGGMQVIPTTPQAMEVLTNRQGDPQELIRRGISIACAPGFSEQSPDTVQELMKYRFTNPVPPAQFQAQVMAGLGMAGLSEEQVAQRMASQKMPVLLLFGEHDNVIPPGNANLMAQKLPDAQVKILPGVGHIFPIEAPQATVEAIVEFLEE